MSDPQWGEGFPRIEPGNLPGEPVRIDIPEPDKHPTPWAQHLESLVLEGMGGASAATPHIIHQFETKPGGGYTQLTFVDSPDGTQVKIDTNLRYGSDSRQYGSGQPAVEHAAQAQALGALSSSGRGNHPGMLETTTPAHELPKRWRRIGVGVVALVVVVGGVYEGWSDWPSDSKVKEKTATSSIVNKTVPTSKPSASTGTGPQETSTPKATDIKIKLPGCSIQSSTVHLDAILPAYLLEHLQQNNKQFRYNIPAESIGDVAIMLCDSSVDAVTLDKANSTKQHAVFDYDLSKFSLIADMTGLHTGVAGQKPHQAYEDIYSQVSQEAVKVDGRHASQDRRTVAPAIVTDMEIMARRKLEHDPIKGALVTQVPAAFQAYCVQQAVAQGYDKDAITCAPVGTLPESATSFASGHNMAHIHSFETPSDPNTRPVYVRLPFKKLIWKTLQTQSVVTGAVS